jgi:hypothetical protein
MTDIIKDNHVRLFVFVVFLQYLIQYERHVDCVH